MLFTYLNVSSPLPKIEEMQQFAELAKSSVIGIGETRLDGYVLNNEIIIVKDFQANPTLLIV